MSLFGLDKKKLKQIKGIICNVNMLKAFCKTNSPTNNIMFKYIIQKW